MLLSGEEGLATLLLLLLWLLPTYRFMMLLGGRRKRDVRRCVVGKAAIAVLIVRIEITTIAGGKKTRLEERMVIKVAFPEGGRRVACE